MILVLKNFRASTIIASIVLSVGLMGGSCNPFASRETSSKAEKSSPVLRPQCPTGQEPAWGSNCSVRVK